MAVSCRGFSLFKVFLSHVVTNGDVQSDNLPTVRLCGQLSVTKHDDQSEGS